MQRRSVAITVIAAAIVVFAGGFAMLRVDHTGERMTSRISLMPRTPADALPSIKAGVELEPQRSAIQSVVRVSPQAAEASANSAIATPSRHDPAPMIEPSPISGATARRGGPPALMPLDPSRNSQAVEGEQPDVREAPASSTGGAATQPGLPARAAGPSFDIVRVEPNGDTLVAGRATPNTTITLVDRDRTVAEARTDAGGNFVLTPPALASGDHALGLREGEGQQAAESQQSVVVSVPHSRSQQVMVALAEPNRPTRVLSAPPAAPALAGVAEAHKTPALPLAIRSVELENGSGLLASGVAPPGTDVRLYLNDSRVADVIAAAAGAWTVTVRKGLTAGHYSVRADSLKLDQSVAARVEVPFDVPPTAIERQMLGSTTRAAAPTTTPVAPPHAATAPVAVAMAEGADAPVAPVTNSDASPRKPSPFAATADVVVDELQTELVSRGDNLWRISRKRLGLGTRYTQIYAANSTQIRDPKLIYPGQVFVMPR